MWYIAQILADRRNVDSILFEQFLVSKLFAQ